MKKILSIVGVHASETPEKIFDRKIQDINKSGQTFWIMRSNLANHKIVQKFCEDENVEVHFIAPATVAQPTKIGKKYSFYSKDKTNWHPLPKEISDVTGSGYGLVLDKLKQQSISIRKIEFTKNDLSIIEKCLDESYANIFFEKLHKSI